MTWQPIEFAPGNVSVLTRTGANLVFAFRDRDEKWRRDDGKEVQPALWLEEDVE